MKKVTKISLGVIGVFFVLIIFVIALGSDSSTPGSSSPNVGDEGRLYVEDSTVVPVCTTKAHLDELVGAAVANDEVGYRNLLSGGKCYTVSTLDDYGRILVLDIGFGARKFGFTNPEAPHYGETAWANSEFIVSLE